MELSKDVDSKHLHTFINIIRHIHLTENIFINHMVLNKIEYCTFPLKLYHILLEHITHVSSYH